MSPANKKIFYLRESKHTNWEQKKKLIILKNWSHPVGQKIK